MKKISQLAVIAAVLLVPFIVSGPALAQSSIDDTGNNSDNEIDTSQSYTCTVGNENNVIINGETVQVSTSGNANNEGNTNGGSATTGTATNSSGTNFTVTIKNDRTCDVAVVPEPETPETPSGGSGESSTPVQPSNNVTPKALPVTSGDTAPVVFMVAGLAAVAGLALAYRRLF